MLHLRDRYFGVPPLLPERRVERRCAMTLTLMQLVDRGDLASVQRILDSALPTVPILNEALWKAVRAGRHELIRLLVERGASAGSKDDQTGWSLVHSAVEHRQRECIRELVELGADVNSTDLAGATPLHLACDLEADAVEQTGREPDPRTVALLLKLGADAGVRDEEGRTPRDWAMASGLEEISDLLA